MRIHCGGSDGTRLYTEVPDDETKEKGLYGPRQFEVRWRHSDDTSTKVGTFALEPMPGCCGIVVSKGSYLEPNQRSQHNISRWFHDLKALTAKHFGYSTMLMTTQLRNFPEVCGASRSKWRFFHAFRNKRTDNDIGIAVKDL
jgi:hypothetical protein